MLPVDLVAGKMRCFFTHLCTRSRRNKFLPYFPSSVLLTHFVLEFDLSELSNSFSTGTTSHTIAFLYSQAGFLVELKRKLKWEGALV